MKTNIKKQLLGFGFLVIGSVASGQITSINWSNTVASGDWNATTSWTGGVVPGEDNRAAFNRTLLTTVTMSSDSVINNVAFNNGETTFDFGSSTLTTAGGLWQLGGVTNRTGVVFNLDSGTLLGIGELRIGAADGSADNVVNLRGGVMNAGVITVGYHQQAQRAQFNMVANAQATSGSMTLRGNNNHATIGGDATLSLAGNTTQGLLLGSLAGTSGNTFEVKENAEVTLTGFLGVSSNTGTDNQVVIKDNAQFRHNYTTVASEYGMRIGANNTTGSQLVVESGLFSSNALVDVRTGADNRIDVKGGKATFSNRIDLRGELRQTGGELEIGDMMVYINGVFDFQAGKMTLGSARFSGSAGFTVGDGSGDEAVLHADGGEFEGTGGGLVIHTDGVLSGSGTFRAAGGETTVRGKLTPGTSDEFGLLSFVSLTLEQQASTLLKVGSSGHDKIHADNLTLAGQLEVLLYDSYVPIVGQSFELLSWGVLNADGFGIQDLVLPDLEDGLTWDTSSLLVDGSLTVIPEVGHLGMLLMAGILILIMQRRFRGQMV